MDFERSIHNAVLQNNITKVKRLLHQVNDMDAYGYTPLLYACRKGNLEMCQLLIQHGACVNQKTRLGEVPCLHRAVMGRHVDVVELLLKNGADRECSDADGRSAFTLALALQEPLKSRMLALLQDN